MKSMALVFVVIIPFLESCHNAHPVEIRSGEETHAVQRKAADTVNTESRCG